MESTKEKPKCRVCARSRQRTPYKNNMERIVVRSAPYGNRACDRAQHVKEENNKNEKTICAFNVSPRPKCDLLLSTIVFPLIHVFFRATRFERVHIVGIFICECIGAALDFACIAL